MTPTQTSFDHDRSLRLDALINKLDARPHPLRCAWLRLSKRLAERRVPAFAGQAVVQ